MSNESNPTVLSVLQDAKPLHCECGYPKCSRNRLRADIDKAVTDLQELIADRNRLANIVRSHEQQIMRMTETHAELIAAGDFMAMNATPGMLARWNRAKAAVQGAA